MPEIGKLDFNFWQDPDGLWYVSRPDMRCILGPYFCPEYAHNEMRRIRIED